MAGGVGSEDPPPPSQHPPLNSGEFLLRLLQKPQDFSYAPAPPPQSYQPYNFSLDPAVAAVGPTIPLRINEGHRQDHSSNLPSWPHSLSPSNSSLSPGPPNFFHQGMSQNPPWPHHPQQQQQQQQQPSAPQRLLNVAPHLQFSHYQRQQEQTKLMFYNMSASLPPEISSNDAQSRFVPTGEREFMFRPSVRPANSSDERLVTDPRGNSGFRTNDRVYGSGEIRSRGPPPGFPGDPVSERRKGLPVNSMVAESNSSNGFSLSDRDFALNGKVNYGRQRRFEDGEISGSKGLSGQIERPGLPSGMAAHSARASEIEESLLNAHAIASYDGDNGKVNRTGDRSSGDRRQRSELNNEVADLSQQLEDTLAVEDEHAEMNDKKQKHRDKDFRSDPRGKNILPQRMRNLKRMMQCRSDIERMNSHFLQIFETLIPTEEEKAKQKRLLTLLDKLVSQEWPKAKLYLYGSCANSFGVSKSDIDVCLVIGGEDIDKSEVLLKLADILKSSNLENVQALTRARVPIVKLADPDTGIACDICLNNVLAVVNTKLLRDYAEIDGRLRQLAFIVKHWAKSRGVNETYQGTLSSYAYVLMCIHFLQQRRPAILPCLQGMRPTYAVKVDEIECAFFDQVEKLRYFGDRNTENIAQLVWGFFNYWAYCHDYANSVISVRSGSTVSKQAKDWTRRIGNDRHLICIEDPFETSHDLGRVVDKHSIRVLREEFERAAEIMQFDPNPCVELFKPYVS